MPTLDSGMTECADCYTPFSSSLSTCPTCGAVAASAAEVEASADMDRGHGGLQPGGSVDLAHDPNPPAASAPPPPAAVPAPASVNSSSLPVGALHSNKNVTRTRIPLPGQVDRFEGVVGGPAQLGSRPIPISPVLAAIVALIAALVIGPATFGEGFFRLLAPFVVVGIGLLGVFVLVRSVSSRGRSQAASGLDVTSFRLVTQAGDNFDCRVFGSIDDGAIRAGDDVEVLGVIRRDRTIRVSKVTNNVTGIVVKPFPPLTYRLLQISQITLVLCAILFAVALISSSVKGLLG